MSRRLALVAMVVTAVGWRGDWAVQTPSAGEAALVIVALEDLQVLAPGARFTAVQEMVLSGPSLWVLDGGPPFVTRVALEGSEAKALGEEEQFPSHHQTPHTAVGAVRLRGIGTWIQNDKSKPPHLVTDKATDGLGPGAFRGCPGPCRTGVTSHAH
jgi:hypothetical protein